MFSLICPFLQFDEFVPYGWCNKAYLLYLDARSFASSLKLASYSSSQTHRCLQTRVNSVTSRLGDKCETRDASDDFVHQEVGTPSIRRNQDFLSQISLWRRPWTSTSGLIGLIGSSWPYLSHPKKIIQSSKLRSYVIDGVSLTLEKRITQVVDFLSPRRGRGE